MVKPGQVTNGPAEPKAVLKRVIELGAQLRVKPDTFVRSDDVVLVLGKHRSALSANVISY